MRSATRTSTSVSGVSTGTNVFAQTPPVVPPCLQAKDLLEGFLRAFSRFRMPLGIVCVGRAEVLVSYRLASSLVPKRVPAVVQLEMHGLEGNRLPQATRRVAILEEILQASWVVRQVDRIWRAALGHQILTEADGGLHNLKRHICSRTEVGFGLRQQEWQRGSHGVHSCHHARIRGADIRA